MYHKKPFDNAVSLSKLLAELDAELERKRRVQLFLLRIRQVLWGAMGAGFLLVLFY